MNTIENQSAITPSTGTKPTNDAVLKQPANTKRNIGESIQDWMARRL